MLQYSHAKVCSEVHMIMHEKPARILLHVQGAIPSSKIHVHVHIHVIQCHCKLHHFLAYYTEYVWESFTCECGSESSLANLICQHNYY